MRNGITPQILGTIAVLVAIFQCGQQVVIDHLDIGPVERFALHTQIDHAIQDQTGDTFGVGGGVGLRILGAITFAIKINLLLLNLG